MAKRSAATKKAKNNMIMFEVASIVITVLPLIIFIGMGFYYGTPQEKVALSLSAIIGLVFAVINVLLKWHLRCGLYIAVFGLCYAFKENADVILAISATMAATTAVDEFILTPLAKRYKERFHINKEIDKRI